MVVVVVVVVLLLLLLIIIIISSSIFISLRVFQASVCRWFLTGVYVITSLFKSPRFFSVFCPIAIMLFFGWCRVFANCPVDRGSITGRVIPKT